MDGPHARNDHIHRSTQFVGTKRSPAQRHQNCRSRRLMRDERAALASVGHLYGPYGKELPAMGSPHM